MERDEKELRALREAEYIVETGATVRETAKHFGISKSTVHKDVDKRIKRLDRALFEAVRHVLERNKAERHLRGGRATQEKYRRIRENVSIKHRKMKNNKFFVTEGKTETT